MNFFYSFTYIIMHSLWQAALLLFFYVAISFFIKSTHPLKKRNVLYFLLLSQLLVSGFTFYLYYNNLSFLSSYYSINNISWINDYAIFFCYTYLAIVLIKMLATLYQWYAFKNTYTKYLIKPVVDVKLFTTLKSMQLGIKQKVQVWYSTQIQVPITFGFFKPIILLPFGLVNDLNMHEIESIILHELTHIKSKDYFLNWMLIALEIIYFYNPFVKILIEKLKIEREKNCDLQVIHFNYDSLNYAQVLLKIAKYNHYIKSFQMGAVKNKTQLFKRIQFFSFNENLAFKKRGFIFYNFLFIAILFISTIFFTQSKKEAKKAEPISFKLINTKATNNIFVENQPSTIYYYENVSPLIIAEPIAITEPINELNIVSNINTDSNYNEAIIPFENMQLIPVAYNEDGIDSVKEIQYNIETADGKMTQSYKLIKHNGIWNIYPQWMITETTGFYDSAVLKKMIDSTYKVLEIQ